MIIRPVKWWTKEEMEFLKENYSPTSVSFVCSKLSRSEKSVTGKAFSMGLSEKDRSRYFTKEEIQIVSEKYLSIGAIGVAVLIGRTPGAVKAWAHRHGFKVSKEYKTEFAVRSNKSWARSEETKRKIGVGHRKEGSKISNILRQKLWPSWNIPILVRDEYKCKTCNSTKDVLVHHVRMFSLIRDLVIKNHPEVSLENIDGRYRMAELIVKEHKLSDGITLCWNCHQKIHGKKPGELQGSLTAKGEGNLQPSPPNVLKLVGGKVQRLTADDTQTNKADTSARHANMA